MLALRLDDETERRLEALAKRTGRTKSYYAREAIQSYIDDLEDFYLAKKRLESFEERHAVSLEELEAEFGLDG
jgi:RHH-type rel operon transcriptional repressor/antitoxin RelB